MRKKKFCHIFFDEYPKDSRVRRYCNALYEDGFEVYIFCIGTKYEPYIEHHDRIHIHRFPISKRRSSFLRRLFEYVVFEIASFLFITFLFITKRVYIYQFHTLPDFLVFSSLIPKLFGAKIILDFHELFPEFMLQLKPSLTENSMSVRILKIQERWSYLFADSIIVFSDPAKEILQKRVSSTKIPTVVMNGIDESEMPNICRERTSAKRIVYNGTINFNLNLQLVLKALNQIRIERPDIYEQLEFHIYGDGPELENLLNEAKALHIETIKYRGRLKFREMMEELRYAWACILPPKKDIYSELFYSLKLVEMIYLKIPVIASRLRTYTHYYPEECIIYFEPGNIDDLSRKIIYLFENEDRIEPLKSKAFQRYQAVSWGIMKQRYLSVVQKQIN